MSYLSTVFQNAKFVHLIRDGRAVVYSLMQKMESGQFHTWEERCWWISGWPRSWQVRWESEHHSQLGLAAFLWKFFTSEIRKEAEEFPELSYMEIQYEKLIESPIETISKILSFANLPPSKFLTDYLNQIKPQRNMNLKWQKAFSNEQKDEINSIFEFCDNNQF